MTWQRDLGAWLGGPLLVLVGAGQLAAQAVPAAAVRGLDELPWQVDARDPLGLDPADADLERLQPPSPRTAPEGPQVLQVGPVVTAFATTHEASHQVHVHLEAGLARVSVEQRFVRMTMSGKWKRTPKKR